MEATVTNGAVGWLRRIPSGARRLASFVTLSFALHALTLITIGPSGVAGAPYNGTAQPEPLRATLQPRGVDAISADGTAEAKNPADEQQSAVGAERAGIPGGVVLPLADRWYTAEELDVLAAPIGQVNLDYPEELEGSGTRGHVFLMLFIDERGVVRKMHVATAEPRRLFDKAAMRAWANVRFAPAQKGGLPVKSQKLLEVAFAPS